jgi:hypothetical protein
MSRVASDTIKVESKGANTKPAAAGIITHPLAGTVRGYQDIKFDFLASRKPLQDFLSWCKKQAFGLLQVSGTNRNRVSP